MPTSRAVDRVAEALGIPVFETPTGWKFFGNLLDAGHIALCGEESFGTGSNHVREKDGLWAVLFWLNILATTGRSVHDLLREHWQRFGRDYYTRHDYEGIDTAAAQRVMQHIEGQFDALVGTQVNGLTVTAADNFSYRDPVDDSVSSGQGLRIAFDDGARIVYASVGHRHLRCNAGVYIERPETRQDALFLDTQTVLDDLIHASRTIADLAHLTGRTAADVVT